jgi:rfaE bifunctional protein kinase chain/domain
MRSTKKILIIGDLILDVFHHGTYIGQSLSHAKTPVALSRSSTYTWGGAGFVVRNMLALGGKISFISALGNDDFAERANRFTHPNLKKLFLHIPRKPTTVKQRFWIGEKSLLGWHQFDNSFLSETFARTLLARVRAELPSVNKVVIADYRHGLLSPTLAKKIVDECAHLHVPLYVDSQISYDNTGNHIWYKGASLFCLNQKEARSIDPRFNQNKPETSLLRLQKMLGAQDIVIKLGAQGSIALIGDEYVKTVAHKVREVDSTGAGDAFIAALALGEAPPTREDLERANLWAALSTTKIGTVISLTSEFKAHLKKHRSRRHLTIS